MKQGRIEGTSSVIFEVLIINCHIEFINLFIFSCLMSNINLFIFNCLTSNFCFPKNIFFGKMMTSYLRDVDKFLRYRTLCISILKYGFPTKCTKLTQFVLFEVLRVPQLWGTSVHLGETSHSFWTQGISLFLLDTGGIKKDLEKMEGFREAFIQRDLYYEQFPKRSSWIIK